MSGYSKEQYRLHVRKYKENDELEMDDDARVSRGSDDGAWVNVWIWVSDEDIKELQQERQK